MTCTQFSGHSIETEHSSCTVVMGAKIKVPLPYILMTTQHLLTPAPVFVWIYFRYLMRVAITEAAGYLPRSRGITPLNLVAPQSGLSQNCAIWKE